MAEFRMPSLGADMDEGTVLEWLVEPGQQVAKGDIVAVVDISKAAVDVECFDSGVVERILVPVGEKVPVGTPLAVIGTGAPEAAGTAEPRARPAEAARPAEPGRTTEPGRPAEAAPDEVAPAEPAPTEAAPAGAAGRARGTEPTRPTRPAEAAPDEAAPAEAARPARGAEAARPASPAESAQPATAGEPTRPAESAEPRARRARKAHPRETEPKAGSTPATRAVPATAATSPQPEPQPQPEPEPEPELERAQPPQAAPPVRALARQAGIDLATVRGTGPGGSVTRADVERLAGPTGRRVSPYARRLARELGVDTAELPGTVHARDVRAAAAGNRPAAETAATEPRRRGEDMRAAIAALMARSKREIPHYYLSSTIDLEAALTWLREYNRGADIAERVLPNALLLKATALAARRVSELNGHWLDGEFRPGDGVRLGVAVSLRGGGLLVPTLNEPGAQPLAELMRRLNDVVTRTRSGRLRSSELEPATITVTNLGELGAESVQGVIYPPQVALVGFGAIVRRPWAVGELLGVRPVVTASLAADHRASDGATGSRFLTALEKLLQRPEELR